MRLQQAVADGLFREDLFYRLNVLPLDVPALRERREDLDQLAAQFFHAYAADKPGRLKGFSAAALRALRAYNWPGNVRELLNRIRRAMVLAEGRLIAPADLGLEMWRPRSPPDWTHRACAPNAMPGATDPRARHAAPQARAAQRRANPAAQPGCHGSATDLPRPPGPAPTPALHGHRKQERNQALEPAAPMLALALQ